MHKNVVDTSDDACGPMLAENDWTADGETRFPYSSDTLEFLCIKQPNQGMFLFLVLLQMLNRRVRNDREKKQSVSLNSRAKMTVHEIWKKGRTHEPWRIRCQRRTAWSIDGRCSCRTCGWYRGGWRTRGYIHSSANNIGLKWKCMQSIIDVGSIWKYDISLLLTKFASRGRSCADVSCGCLWNPFCTFSFFCRYSGKQSAISKAKCMNRWHLD